MNGSVIQSLLLLFYLAYLMAMMQVAWLGYTLYVVRQDVEGKQIGTFGLWLLFMQLSLLFFLTPANAVYVKVWWKKEDAKEECDAI